MSQTSSSETGASICGGSGGSGSGRWCAAKRVWSDVNFTGLVLVRWRFMRLFQVWCLSTMAWSQRWKEAGVAGGRSARPSSEGTRVRSKFRAAKQRGCIPLRCESDRALRTYG
eukprot:6163648-Amphidinium_carterae.3